MLDILEDCWFLVSRLPHLHTGLYWWAPGTSRRLNHCSVTHTAPCSLHCWSPAKCQTCDSPKLLLPFPCIIFTLKGLHTSPPCYQRLVMMLQLFTIKKLNTTEEVRINSEVRECDCLYMPPARINLKDLPRIFFCFP